MKLNIWKTDNNLKFKDQFVNLPERIGIYGRNY